MCKGVKLTNKLININDIHMIYFYPEKSSYRITLNAQSFGGLLIYGTGVISTDTNNIYVKKEKEPIDFDIIKSFVEKE